MMMGTLCQSKIQKSHVLGNAPTFPDFLHTLLLLSLGECRQNGDKEHTGGTFFMLDIISCIYITGSNVHTSLFTQ